MITIELDKPRKLDYSIGSIRKGKMHFGKGIISMMSIDNAGPDAVIDILWIGLIQEDPTLTILKLDEIVGTWLQQPGNNYDVLQNIILQALIEDKAIPGVAEKNLKSE